MQTYAQARHSHERLAAGLGWFSLALGTAELAAPRTVARLIGIPDDPRLVNVLRAFGAREIASGLGMLAQPRQAGWAWSRVGGDAIDLAFLGSAANEDSADRSRVALAAAAVAGVTALDIICARTLADDASWAMPASTDRARRATHVFVDQAVTVKRPIDEVFAFWKDYGNLPRFMRHLTSVETLAEGRTRWTATGPAGIAVSWDAETVAEEAPHRIAWRSLENADVHNHGEVRFTRAAADRGTEVHVHLEYKPPAGSLGRGIAWLFGEEPRQQVKEDLRRFKQLMETGEIPLAEGSGLRAAQPASDVQEIGALAGVSPELVGAGARLEGGHA
ncbi:hypothetical protein TBR22_A02410 [Luteitalea sp. TBR-22]|uniref:SRPBCC family protein n=1 Tax=Luteitalea sp. TBR-22 TaxID=2802971 RepID=UPI001AF0468B|nr:SRPBCC family protein [Luteitalea sp. TBR-22]BCS31042.1 hypothetical protein TBR22_A02410 [Luteitalea sp. TBR-22]